MRLFDNPCREPGRVSLGAGNYALAREFNAQGALLGLSRTANTAGAGERD